MELGKNIAKIRKDNNLTQDDFAEKYFVTRQTVSNWENSKSYPDLETLVKISDDFNVSLDVLLKEDKKMVKDISTKQKSYSKAKILIIGLNIIGILCLIYFAIPYITHDTTIPNPNAMLAGPRWDLCGFALVLGIIPLLIVNIFAYNFVELKHKKIKLLYFIPSLICIVLGIHYLIISTITIINSEPQPEPVKLATITCKLKNKEFEYDIYSGNGELSFGIDEKDKIDLSMINYDSKEEIIKSLTDYYEKQGGSCKQVQ